MGVAAQVNGHDTNAEGAVCSDGSSGANAQEAGTGLEGDQNASAADEGVNATDEGQSGEKSQIGDESTANDETLGETGTSSTDGTSSDCEKGQKGDNEKGATANSSLKSEGSGVDQDGSH
jgi:hypothetical protein